MKFLFITICLCFSLTSTGQNLNDLVANEFIVKFNTNESLQPSTLENFYTPALHQLHSQIQVSIIHEIKSKKPSNTFVLKFNNNTYTIEDVLALYEATGLFEYVEPNFIGKGSGVLKTVPNDANYSNQWALNNDGTFSLSDAVSGADIEMELAWDIETGDPDLVVAIIDSGVRMSHPEFEERVWINPNEVIDGQDTDNNGFVDDLVGGWDFINGDNEPIDDHGHGTNVAGIALATGDNEIGYAGINWHSKMMVCKALNEQNSGTYAAMAGAIYYSVDNGAKVINMSIGGASESFTLSNAIDYCHENGVVLVASMMNFNNDVRYYPAAFDKTIAVGSTDPDDSRSSPFFWEPTSGSNYGSHIDLVAPGNFIYGLDATNDWWYGSYWGGTSQATPIVAGVVSLILSQDPTLTFEEIRTILTESAEDQVGDSNEDTNGFDRYHGHGRLNAYQALTHHILDVNSPKGINGEALLYPNPLPQGIDIAISNLKAGKYDVIITNTVGQNVFRAEDLIVETSSMELPTANLRKGSYIIQMTSKSEDKVESKKVIVE